MKDIRNLEEMQVMQIEGMEICEYHPFPEALGYPTEVHILFTLVGTPVQLVFRMKSKEAVDETVDALIHHRQNVWGER
jgi:hypothetical protein